MVEKLIKKPIRRALVSVSDKTGIISFCEFLEENDVHIISTGGTANILMDAGVKVTDVSDYTGFPEILDGRVKTLHPKIHAGILGKRNDPKHIELMNKKNILPIDLVIVNLYPFAKTIQDNADFESCIENIDIGGPAMIRAAAKNHDDVVVAINPEDYQKIKAEMLKHKGKTTSKFRLSLASQAYAHTANYDSIIAKWMSKDSPYPENYFISGILQHKLRYGENPHMSAAFYNSMNDIEGITSANQIQGKELSYNNINDTDSAFELVSEFDGPAIAIIKHANPCGVATGKNSCDAFVKAFNCDPDSAYGGIIAANQTIDGKTAELICKNFVEVLIAPGIDKEARKLFETKKNLRILINDKMTNLNQKEKVIRSVAGGFLIQDRDSIKIGPENLKVVTKRSPSEAEVRDLLFAFKVCKHTKSNAIVYAKEGMTVGIGAGQMSRVDASRIAAWKAGYESSSENRAVGSVVASDAFFPFADGLLAAAKAGATAIIQPGGSKRDAEVIEAADRENLAMVFTGIRNFRH
tara:strand:+ start:59760 stop:61331 length:1572 start_codon:yes stop_codon:yes gene_type:complete